MNDIFRNSSFKWLASFSALAATSIALATPTANAFGFTNVYTLSWNVTNVTTDISGDGPYYPYNQGPDYHYTGIDGPADPSNPATPMFVRTSAGATGKSMAAVFFTGETLFTLTNSTELPEQAVLSFGAALVSQVNADDPTHQRATNEERFTIVDSMSQIAEIDAHFSTDTLIPGDQIGYYDFHGSNTYNVGIGQTLEVYVLAYSSSSAVSAVPQATPEPTSFAAMGLGLGMIGLGRSRRKRRIKFL